MKKIYWMISGGILITVLIVAIVLLNMIKSNHHENGKTDGDKLYIDIEDDNNQTEEDTLEKDNSLFDNRTDVEDDTQVVTPSVTPSGADNNSTTSDSTTNTTTSDEDGEEKVEEKKTDSESNSIELPFVPFP